MVRELRRLLLSPQRLSAAADSLQVPLGSDERHYLSRVLRLRSGDAFAVVDGAGHLWRAQLDDSNAALQQPLAEPLQTQPAPLPPLQLAVALPRRDSDVLLRMVTELGIDQLVPLLAERSVLERWNRQRAEGILREAVEQCERLWLPQLAEPQPVSAWLAAGEPGGLRLLATTREADVPELSALLASQQHLPAMVSLAIGPEGGWSPTELTLALKEGWQPVGLGPTILRSSTAAVAAAALLNGWRQSLSS